MHFACVPHQYCSCIDHNQEWMAHCGSGAGRGEHPAAGLRLPAQDPPPPWQGEGGRPRRASQQGATLLQDLYSTKFIAICQVDDCVEIPQSGLVRSFNVHVTGAVVLWEAVKQLSKL